MSPGTRPSVPRTSVRGRPNDIPVVTPFAPGNVPKRWSKVRFSLIRNTTCLIGVAVSSAFASNASGLRVVLTLGLEGAGGELVALGSASLALHAAAISPRPRTAATHGNARRCEGVLMDVGSLSSAGRAAAGGPEHLGRRGGRALPRER